MAAGLTGRLLRVAAIRVQGTDSVTDSVMQPECRARPALLGLSGPGRVRAAGSNINAQAAESVTQCLGAGLGQAQPPGPPGAACGSRAWPTGRLAAAGLSHVAAGRVPVTPRSLRARPPWHSVSDSDCQGNCHSPGTTQWQVAALPGPVAGSRDSRLPLGPTLAASVTEYY